MKSEEYIEKVRHLDWLRGIVRDYEQNLRFIEQAGKDFVITAIHYNFHGPATMCLNNHRSIDSAFIFYGLENALSKVKDEITSIEKELQSITVEL